MNSTKQRIENLISAVKAQREAAGLLVEWSAIPDPWGRTRYFAAYAKDEAQKAEWIANGAAKGWVLKA